jgi:predicted dehydrogenase
MNLAFIGCGHVFDYYISTMWAHNELKILGIYDIDNSRANKVGNYYEINVYESLDSLLNDKDIDIIVNLTNINSHYDVSKKSLEAGKHVYSEKPLTTNLEETKELFKIAKMRNLIFSGAPCNIFSDSVCTMWKAIIDKAIGKPVLVYAEFDDNPIHLSNFMKSKGPTGAPWPYIEEFEQGCTFEHIGYHLVWICAIFGPVKSLTAFSKNLIKNKTNSKLSPPNTPDYSVACLNFDNGVTARITCNIVAPRDYRMRIIGDEGEILCDRYSNYKSPVFLERFSKSSLNARKLSSVRRHLILGRLFGVGGYKIPLINRWKSHAIDSEKGYRRTFKQKIISWIRRRETHAQDKMLGIAEMAHSIRHKKPQLLTPEYLIHINELTLLIQRASEDGIATSPSTTFEQIKPFEDIKNSNHDYLKTYKQSYIEKIFGALINFTKLD